MPHPHTASYTGRRTSRAARVSMLLALMMTGCAQNALSPHEPNFDLVSGTERHPILVTERPTTLAVAVPPGSSGLSPASRSDVLAFARRARADSSDARIAIAAPSGTANEAAAREASGEIRELLIDAGYAENAVQVMAYRAHGHRHPPVRLGYRRHVAEGPTCGHWPTNLAYQPDNGPMPNLGCAQQRNFAAMVVNPSDLLRPRAETERSGERRDVVWDKYRKGQSTASAKNEDGRVTTQGGN